MSGVETTNIPRPGLGARTAEEAERRRFGLWCLIAFVVLLPTWWIWGADAFSAAMKPLAAVFMAVFGLPGPIAGGWGEAWKISTDLDFAAGQGELVLTVDRDILRRLSLGVPLFAAFITAPPRTPRIWRAVGIGALVLVAGFLVCVTGYVWGEIAPALNPALAPAGATAGAALSEPPLNPIAAQTALMIRYFGMSAGPLFLAALLWAVLNEGGRTALLGVIRDEPR